MNATESKSSYFTLKKFLNRQINFLYWQQQYFPTDKSKFFTSTTQASCINQSRLSTQTIKQYLYKSANHQKLSLLASKNSLHNRIKESSLQ